MTPLGWLGRKTSTQTNNSILLRKFLIWVFGRGTLTWIRYFPCFPLIYIAFAHVMYPWTISAIVMITWLSHELACHVTNWRLLHVLKKKKNRRDYHNIWPSQESFDNLRCYIYHLCAFLTPLLVLFYLSFTFQAVLYLRYLSIGISSHTIDGKPIIFGKVSPLVTMDASL